MQISDNNSTPFDSFSVGKDRCPVKASLDYIAKNDPLDLSKNEGLRTTLTACKQLTPNQWRWVNKFIKAHTKLLRSLREGDSGLERRLKELHRLESLVILPELKETFGEGLFRRLDDITKKMQNASVEHDPTNLFREYNEEIRQINEDEREDRKKVYGGQAAPGFVYDSVFHVRQLTRRGTLDQERKTTLLLAELKDAFDLGLVNIESSYAIGGSRSNESTEHPFIIEMKFDKSKAENIYGNRFQELTNAGKISLVYVPSQDANGHHQLKFKGISLWGGVYKHSPREQPKPRRIMDKILFRSPNTASLPKNRGYSLDYPMLYDPSPASENDLKFINQINGLRDFLEGLGNLPRDFWHDQDMHGFDLTGIGSSPDLTFPKFVEQVQREGYEKYRDLFNNRPLDLF